MKEHGKTIVVQASNMLHRAAVVVKTGWSKSSLYLNEKNGLFCPAISIGSRAVRYPENEVDAVILARVRGEGDEQIRELVEVLIEQRKLTVLGR